MTERTFSPASIVTCWLFVLTQHKPLVDELAGTKGLLLDRHICNLATHLMTLLEDQVIDPEVVERARRAHARVNAFGDDKRPMAIFVLDSFALVAYSATLPQLATFDAINNLALAHKAPVETGTLHSRAERAIKTLAVLNSQWSDNFESKLAITGDAGFLVISGFIESPEGAQALRIDDRQQHLEECRALFGAIQELTDLTGAQDIIDNLVMNLSR